jgi:hypothetical protein
MFRNGQYYSDDPGSDDGDGDGTGTGLEPFFKQQLDDDCADNERGSCPGRGSGTTRSTMTHGGSVRGTTATATATTTGSTTGTMNHKGGVRSGTQGTTQKKQPQHHANVNGHGTSQGVHGNHKNAKVNGKVNTHALRSLVWW